MSARVAYVVGQSVSIDEVKSHADAVNKDVAELKASSYDAITSRWPEGQAIDRLDQTLASYEKLVFNDFNRWTIDIWKPLYEKAKAVVNSTADEIDGEINTRQNDLRVHKSKLQTIFQRKPSELFGQSVPMPSAFDPQLQEGQKLLLKLGYDLGAEGADGMYDLLTSKAIVEFQGKMSLNRTGLLDASTLEKLRSEAAKIAPTPTVDPNKKTETKTETQAAGSTVKGIPLSTLGMVAAGVAGLGAVLYLTVGRSKPEKFRYSEPQTPVRY